MKLYATMTGDRGKAVSKSSNDVINITFTENRRQKFDITFYGDTVKVMRYSDATDETVKYIKGDKKCATKGCNNLVLIRNFSRDQKIFS